MVSAIAVSVPGTAWAQSSDWGSSAGSDGAAAEQKPNSGNADQPVAAPVSAGKPVAYSQPFFLPTNTPAYGATKTETNPELKKLYYQIGGTPSATWLDGSHGNEDARLKKILDNAQAAGETPQFVIYGIPNRDCSGWSAGGHSNGASYKQWIDKVSATIGDAKTVVVIEPDAINFCGQPEESTQRHERKALLNYTAQTLKRNNPNTAAYLHAGGEGMQANHAAAAIADSGIEHLRGFAVNVAGHGATEVEQAWAEEVVTELEALGIKDKYYVVDTSRNGVGDPPATSNSFASCNNFNAAVGPRPTASTTAPHADAYLWIKQAGNSDGDCGSGGPAAGEWYPDLAKAVIERAIDQNIIEEEAVPADF